MKDQATYVLQSLLERHFKNEMTIRNGEAIIRCPFCGDSSASHKAHFYIKLGSETEAPLYHCFKCEAKGLFTPDIIRTIIPDQEITQKDIEDLQIIAESITGKVNFSKMRIGYHKISRSVNYNYQISDIDLAKKKLDYINQRLGLSMSIEEAQKNKIVFNLKELLQLNQLSSTTLPSIIEDIHTYFVGFLSLDNSYLIMRNTEESKSYIKSRYYNYELFNKNLKHIRNYCIPAQIDVLSKDPIKIHVAEGCFDILSIFYHLRNQNRQNNIYIASNGKGYFNVVRTLIESYGLENIEIHYYPDKDVSNEELSHYIQKLLVLNIPIYIHRNNYKGEKDFGVSKDRIDEIVCNI